ncbi:hypothetical protein Lal_00034911 [Lupinus albus]|nr:hypothetical protein Lal_00034911 [Lupinus albus]
MEARLFLGPHPHNEIQCPTLPLESIDDIHRRDGLPSGVLSVSNGVTDDVFQEDLENTTCLFIDKTTNTLNSTSTSQTTNGGLSDTLDVIT